MVLALFRTESDQRINCPIRTNTQRFCLARAVHYQPAPHHPGTRQEPWLIKLYWSFEFWRTWLTVSEGPPDLADWIRTTERSDLAGRLGHKTDRRRSGGRCTPVFRR